MEIASIVTTASKVYPYIARLIQAGRVVQTLEFEAADDRAAWLHANDGIDPLCGLWVSVERKPDPQQAMDLPPAPNVSKEVKGR